MPGTSLARHLVGQKVLLSFSPRCIIIDATKSPAALPSPRLSTGAATTPTMLASQHACPSAVKLRWRVFFSLWIEVLVTKQV